MDGRISMVTLGVDDLARSRTFYEALGWVVAPQSQESVVFLQGRNIVLGLYGRQALAEDAGVSARRPVSPVSRWHSTLLPKPRPTGFSNWRSPTARPA